MTDDDFQGCAVAILEKIMFRRWYSSGTREAIAEAILGAAIKVFRKEADQIAAEHERDVSALKKKIVELQKKLNAIDISSETEKYPASDGRFTTSP